MIQREGEVIHVVAEYLISLSDLLRSVAYRGGAEPLLHVDWTAQPDLVISDAKSIKVPTRNFPVEVKPSKMVDRTFITQRDDHMPDTLQMVVNVQRAWAAPNQPSATLEAAGDAFAQTVGYRLYTVTQMLSGGLEVERIYSTNVAVYPVGCRKPMLPNAHTQRVRGEMQPFLAKTPAEFAPLFPDHETITSLGLGSVMNLPVVFNGVLLGTVNLLDSEGAYHEQHVEQAMLIARQLVPALLVASG
jgi:GAF domain-containing protein